jgi:hypothetical protein
MCDFVYYNLKQCTQLAPPKLVLNTSIPEVLMFLIQSVVQPLDPAAESPVVGRVAQQHDDTVLHPLHNCNSRT